jgi:glycosyltransferase involved in cell wall biosynthesis
MAPFMARKIEEMGIHRGKVVSANFGVDEALLDVQAQSRKGRPILVCTRMLDEVYNHATLIKALAVVRKTHPDVLLRLAGDGPCRKPLEALVNELGLQTNVEFAGFLSGRKLIGALSAADLYLSTSFSDGTSVSLLEAMAVGLFPIVSDIEGNRDWIADGANGFLVNPHNIDGLAARITLALSKVDWRREVCQQNKELVKQRALRKNQMDIMEQAYRELL